MATRPSVSHDSDVVLKRTKKISNFINSEQNETTSIVPDFPLAREQLRDKKAGPSVGFVATDISMGGLLPGTTSSHGGTNPFNNAALHYRTILQDQPQSAWTRKT